MKKIIFALSLSLVLSSAAYADGNAFTPLNFNDTSYGTTSNKTQAIYSTSLPSSTITPDEAIGNGNIQNAISQLENAQVDIRNELLNYKTKFADIDAQYKLVKAERKNVKSQVKAVEKRIKEIEKAKEKIRKNML